MSTVPTAKMQIHRLNYFIFGLLYGDRLMAHNGFVGDLTKVKRMFSAHHGSAGRQ